MFTLVAIAQSAGLTARSILTDLPHDATSIVGYFFILVFFGFVALGFRRGGGKPKGPALGG